MSNDDLPEEPLRLSDLRAKYPGSSKLSDDEFLRRLHKHKFPQLSTKEFVSRIDYDTQREQLQKEATQGGMDIGPLHVNEENAQALANLGAGMSNLGVRARQWFGNGVSDEEIQDKRKLDEILAENTPLGRTTQVAGEVLPVLAATAGAPLVATAAGITKIPALARAVQAWNASKAGKFAQGQGYLPAAAKGAVAGAAQGTLTPTTSDESTLENAGEGAAWGAAVPVGLKAAGRGARAVKEKVTTAGQRRAAQKDVTDLIEENAEDLAAIKARLKADPDVIPLTAAAQAESDALARGEIGSRVRAPQKWRPFDTDQARAIDKTVMEATSEAETAKGLRKERGEAWDSDKDLALTVNDEERVQKLVPRFRQSLEIAKRTPEGMKGTRTREALDAATTALDELENAGEPITAAHLMQLRKELNKRPTFQSSTAYEKADPDDPAIRSIITAVDDLLDKSTRGAWRGVTGGYAMRSKPVEKAEAAQRVRDVFVDAEGYPLKRSVAGVPDYTSQALTKVMDKEVSDLTGQSNLSEAARGGLKKTRDALMKKERIEAVRKSGSGWNSATSTNAAAAADQGLAAAEDLASNAVEKSVPVLGKVWGAAKNFSNYRKNRILDEAYRDPAKMSSLIDPRFEPPNYTVEALLKVLRGASSPGGLGAWEGADQTYPY